MTVATAAAPAGLVERRLRAARRRLWTQEFVAWHGKFLLATAGALLAWGVVRFLGGEPVWHRGFAAVLVLVPLVLAAVCTAGLDRETWSLARTAQRLDRLAHTHDRCQTALAFAARPVATRTPLETMALDECTRFVAGFDFRSAIPWRMPRAWGFTIFPLVSLACLVLYAALGIGQPSRDPALADAVNRRAETLEKIADRLHRDPSKSPELDKIADAMKRAAERLKAGERTPDEARLKESLKELSSLEAMLAAMKQAQQDGKITPAELNALAAALAASEKTRPAAESLQAGQLEKAAGQLEQLLQQLQQQGNAAQALQQLAQSMQEQAAKLSAQERSEVARQMEQAAQAAQSGQPQLSQQALQRLAELLRRNAQNGGNSSRQQASNGQGKPMTEKQLQDLINSLENMKDGLRPGDGKSPGQPGEGQGEGSQMLATVESFGAKPGDPSGGDKPSGMPGGEHDTGHPENLYQDKPVDTAKAGEAHRLEGLLGEGETLQELTAAGAGSPAKAGRRYKELYDAMAPAAQETVEQENIPLGSRAYIRRYFENIRPKE